MSSCESLYSRLPLRLSSHRLALFVLAEVAEEMDRMLQTFFRASKAVEAVLGRLGHWSCSIGETRNGLSCCIKACRVSCVSPEPGGAVPAVSAWEGRRHIHSPSTLLLQPPNPKMTYAPLPVAVSTQQRLKSLFATSSADPLTGLAMRGTPGERYSEVRGARTLLGYSVNDAGPLPLLSHPVVGTRVYPATLFTTAPPDAAAAAVREALSRAPTVAYPPWPHRQAGPAIVTDAGGSGAAPVVALTGVSCALPDGRWAVRGLTVSVPAGGALLLRGPSGCGKTTLLRSLCGLRPLHSGHVALPPHDRVMFLPQRPLLAVGTGEDPGLTTLRQQVVYPLSVTASGSFDEETRVREAVEGAGLGDALARVGGDVDREARWGAAMSPGEQQRVAVARVLYHRCVAGWGGEGCATWADGWRTWCCSVEPYIAFLCKTGAWVAKGLITEMCSRVCVQAVGCVSGREHQCAAGGRGGGRLRGAACPGRGGGDGGPRGVAGGAA